MINYNGYLDQYGLVSCNRTPATPAPDTDNGLLFTAVAQFSEYENDVRKCIGLEPATFNFVQLFNKCFDCHGILYRRPSEDSPPDSHDNYLGAMLGSLLEGNYGVSRKLLWSLLKHFGVVRGEIFLRFPQVWMLLWSASCPILKYLLFPFNYILYLFQNPKDAKNNTSSAQLQLTIVEILDILYPRMNYFTKWKNKLPCSLYEIFSTYYGESHPTTLQWKEE